MYFVLTFALKTSLKRVHWCCSPKTSSTPQPSKKICFPSLSTVRRGILYKVLTSERITSRSCFAFFSLEVVPFVYDGKYITSVRQFALAATVLGLLNELGFIFSSKEISHCANIANIKITLPSGDLF